MLKKIYERLKQKGQGVVEYALLLGVVAVILVGFTTNNGLISNVKKALYNVTDHFTKFNSAYSNN
ncbi:MAG: hypothetical protein II902_03785 [Selenomonadaceae bacterium]|nr:hypothetical protein [Selenomonadaceae bacterium]